MPASAATLIPLIAQLGLGGAQYLGGRKMARNNEFPEMQMPEGFLEALSSIQAQSTDKYAPGEQITRSLENENIAGLLSQLVGTTGSAGDISQALTSVYGGQMRNENVRGANRENYFANLKESERAMLLKKAELENMLYQNNELAPYQQNAAAASALQGSGIQNVFGSLLTGSMMGMNGAFDKKATDVVDPVRQDMEKMDTIQPSAISNNVDRSAIGLGSAAAPRSTFDAVMGLNSLIGPKSVSDAAMGSASLSSPKVETTAPYNLDALTKFLSGIVGPTNYMSFN